MIERDMVNQRPMDISTFTKKPKVRNNICHSFQQAAAKLPAAPAVARDAVENQHQRNVCDGDH